MRWLTVLLLWVAAIVVGLVVLRRVRRGKPVVLTGRWSPRLVRMVAVVLVVLGAGDESAPPGARGAPAKIPVKPTDDELPGTLNPRAVQLWLHEHQEGGMYEPGNRLLLRALAGQKIDANPLVTAKDHLNRLPAKLRSLAQVDLAAVTAGKPASTPTDADLLEALDEMEKVGRFDHAWNAYLWRKAAGTPKDPAARIRLFDRVRQHARITDALVKAYAQVKPVMLPPQAWGGKGGRPPAWAVGPGGGPNALTDILKVAAQELPFTDEGTWKRDGVALIKPAAGSPPPVLIRAGKERVLPADESTRVGRLDLLRTGEQPAVVVHDWLGKIELPAHRLVSVHELPDFLSKGAKEKLDQTVLDALKSNSEDAADRLERCLAVSHEAIRVGLKELPTAKGAPRLRLILSLFDDTVMPALPVHRAEAPGQFGGGEFGPGGR